MSTPAPRVLFVDHTAKLGGAELSLFSVAESLKASCRVVLFEDGPFLERLRSAGVDAQVLCAPAALDGVRRTGTIRDAIAAGPALLGMAWRLAGIARRFDVVVANSQKSMLVAGLAGILARRPVVWYLRDLLLPSHFGPLQRRVAAWAARYLMGHVIANSHATKTALVDLGGPADHITVVYNGIDPAPFEAVTEADVAAVRRDLDLPPSDVVGVFSRLAEWKGQHVLLEAIRDLPSVTALLVGGALFHKDERYADRLRADIDAWGLADRVRILGFREDVPALMRTCDVVVHTSTAPEPFGRVIVEGMMAGRPVIATEEGGPAEIVSDGTSGLLVTPGDAPALADALKRVLETPDTARHLADRGRALADTTFTTHEMTRQFRAILALLVSALAPAPTSRPANASPGSARTDPAAASRSDSAPSMASIPPELFTTD